MNEKLARIMEKAKKNGKDMKHLDPMEQHAKLSVLNDLKGVASDALKEKLHGLKKVQVMSDSDEGLKAGLGKAEDLISQAADHENKDMDVAHMDHDAEDGLGRGPDEFAGEGHEHDEDAEYDADKEHEASPEEADESAHDEAEEEAEEPAEDHEDGEDMDEEELNAKIQHLMAMKNKKAKKA